SFLRIIIVAAVALAVITCADAAELKVGDVFPDLTQFSLAGELPREHRGKVVLVDFWASWCAPCKSSFPALNELSSKFAKRGFVVIGISVDESKAAMQQFLKSTPAQFSVLHDAQQKLVQRLNVEAMPTSFLIDGTGRVRFIHSGFDGQKTRDAYAREIENLLSAAAAK
ncbi:MAG TPA: TlpA disulfide reductase family protein, partial [Methylomirabilota bacterium]|nr:TlpA disulfide reductase family protein [Methylomirabilota bacterium]